MSSLLLGLIKNLLIPPLKVNLTDPNGVPVAGGGAAVALGRAAAAASLPSVLSTEDAAKVPALGTAAMAASTPVTLATNDTQSLALLAALASQLAQLVLAVAALGNIVPSGSQTAITPSDSTDYTATASQGLFVTSIGGGATLVTRGATTTSTSVTQTVVAGQFVPGAFSRVMAATTCTVIGYAP